MATERKYFTDRDNRIGGIGGAPTSPSRAQDDHVVDSGVSVDSLTTAPHPDGMVPGTPRIQEGSAKKGSY